jgi:hypothetical protein
MAPLGWGCFHFSYGTRTPTMAYELKELRKLRDKGTISDEEFLIGKNSLLRHGKEPASNPLMWPDAEIVTLPSVSDDDDTISR